MPPSSIPSVPVRSHMIFKSLDQKSTLRISAESVANDIYKLQPEIFSFATSYLPMQALSSYKMAANIMTQIEDLEAKNFEGTISCIVLVDGDISLHGLDTLLLGLKLKGFTVNTGMVTKTGGIIAAPKPTNAGTLIARGPEDFRKLSSFAFQLGRTTTAVDALICMRGEALHPSIVLTWPEESKFQLDLSPDLFSLVRSYTTQQAQMNERTHLILIEYTARDRRAVVNMKTPPQSRLPVAVRPRSSAGMHASTGGGPAAKPIHRPSSAASQRM